MVARNSCNSDGLATPKRSQYGSWDNPEATRQSRSLAQDQRSYPVPMEAVKRRETIWGSANLSQNLGKASRPQHGSWSSPEPTRNAGVARTSSAVSCHCSLPPPDGVGKCIGLGGSHKSENIRTTD